MSSYDYTALLAMIMLLLLVIVVCLVAIGLDISQIKILLGEIRDRLPAVVEAAP